MKPPVRKKRNGKRLVASTSKTAIEALLNYEMQSTYFEANGSNQNTTCGLIK